VLPDANVYLPFVAVPMIAKLVRGVIQNDCSVFNCNIALATGENTPSFGALTEFHPRNSLNVGVILKAENGVILPFSVVKT